jgi:hypothetical protein
MIADVAGKRVVIARSPTRLPPQLRRHQALSAGRPSDRRMKPVWQRRDRALPL